MVNKILKCNKCNKYTLKDICLCGEKTYSPKPAKFSPGDKYSKYRIIYKKEHNL